jgi:hypothetical protein
MQPALRYLKSFLQRLRVARYRRSIAHSLALNRRGEARGDGLPLVSVRNQLKIRWRARRVHPWEQHLSQAERISAFHEQLLSDTEAAVARLFDALPQLDLVELSVLEPASENILLAGTISRSDLQEVRSSSLQSIRMRLIQLGVHWAPGESLSLD